jgi:RNA polymerase sigma factor (sigma-70 family)
LSSPSDPKLDPGVIAALFLEHADELRRFAYGILRDHDSAGDVLQATFAKAVERGHTAREETLKGWLFRVAYNEAIVVKRKQAVRTRHAETLAHEPTAEPPLPEQRLVRFEDIQRMRQALETLSPELRTVVRLRMYEGKKFAEIAAELQWPLGTVLTRMRAALAQLRKMLDRG